LFNVIIHLKTPLSLPKRAHLRHMGIRGLSRAIEAPDTTNRGGSIPTIRIRRRPLSNNRLSIHWICNSSNGRETLFLIIVAKSYLYREGTKTDWGDQCGVKGAGRINNMGLIPGHQDRYLLISVPIPMSR